MAKFRKTWQNKKTIENWWCCCKDSFFFPLYSYTKAFTHDAPSIDPFPNSDSIYIYLYIYIYPFKAGKVDFSPVANAPQAACQESKVYILHVIAVVLGNWMKLGHLSIASSSSCKGRQTPCSSTHLAHQSRDSGPCLSASLPSITLSTVHVEGHTWYDNEKQESVCVTEAKQHGFNPSQITVVAKKELRRES